MVSLREVNALIHRIKAMNVSLQFKIKNEITIAFKYELYVFALLSF